MSESSPAPDNGSARWRGPQFTLAARVVVMCCLAVVFALFGQLIRLPERESPLAGALLIGATVAAPLLLMFVVSAAYSLIRLWNKKPPR
ncbi:MAG: hypothetical protein N2C14_08210 [Planctomycetales bacterium]